MQDYAFTMSIRLILAFNYGVFCILIRLNAFLVVKCPDSIEGSHSTFILNANSNCTIRIEVVNCRVNYYRLPEDNFVNRVACFEQSVLGCFKHCVFYFHCLKYYWLYNV